MAIDLQVLNNGVWTGPLTDNPSYAGPVVGQACKMTLWATGGTAPYTFTVTSGSLPTGLSIFKDTRFSTSIPRDFIQGTPASQGPYGGQGVGFPTYPGLTKFQLFNFTLHIVDSLAASADITCSILVYEKQCAQMCLPPIVFGQDYSFQLSSDYVADIIASLNNSYSESLTAKSPNAFRLNPGFFNNPELILMGLTLSSTGLLHVPVQTVYHSLPSTLSRSCLSWIEIEDSDNNWQAFNGPIVYIDTEYTAYDLSTTLQTSVASTVSFSSNTGVNDGHLTLISGSLPTGISIVNSGGSSGDFEGTPTIAGIYTFVFQSQMVYGLTSQANGRIIVTGTTSACNCAEDLAYLKTYL